MDDTPTKNDISNVQLAEYAGDDEIVIECSSSASSFPDREKWYVHYKQKQTKSFMKKQHDDDNNRLEFPTQRRGEQFNDRLSTKVTDNETQLRRHRGNLSLNCTPEIKCTTREDSPSLKTYDKCLSEELLVTERLADIIPRVERVASAIIIMTDDDDGASAKK